MATYLLDTNTISEPARKRPDLVVASRVRERSGEIAICAPVWHELAYGMARMPEGRHRRSVEDYLLGFVASYVPILPFDEAAASWLASERARLEAAGTPRPFADGLVAAVAATQGLVLVTRNVRDFEGYEGLGVENWFDAGQSTT